MPRGSNTEREIMGSQREENVFRIITLLVSFFPLSLLRRFFCGKEEITANWTGQMIEHRTVRMYEIKRNTFAFQKTFIGLSA